VVRKGGKVVERAHTLYVAEPTVAPGVVSTLERPVPIQSVPFLLQQQMTLVALKNGVWMDDATEVLVEDLVMLHTGQVMAQKGENDEG